MSIHPADKPPPDPGDLEGWRVAVAEGRFRGFQKEAVIAAIQDLGVNADKEMIRELVIFVSDDLPP